MKPHPQNVLSTHSSTVLMGKKLENLVFLHWYMFDLYLGIPQKAACSQSSLVLHYILLTQCSATNRTHFYIDCDQCWHWDKENLDVFEAKIEEMLNGWRLRDTWLVQLVLYHWATTNGKPSTLTILYMYCTGGTESCIQQSLSMCCQNPVRDWLRNSVHQKRVHAEWLSWSK